jgi:hypothetical protein
VKGWTLVALALLTGACATAETQVPTADLVAAEVAGFEFATDTFAFPNEVRAHNPPGADLYANYCFVLARSLRQFFLFARFDPAGPRLASEDYVARVREVVERPPWGPALPADDRVVIPGYRSLREFSAAQEAAVKEGLGGRFWTLVHWTNWRVGFPMTAAQQERVARETVAELRAGRLVQMLVTNLPKVELNHTVVAFGYRRSTRGIEFAVWDPNEPGAAGVVLFDEARRRFWAERMFDTEPGVIRAFRMYYSWLW